MVRGRAGDDPQAGSLESFRGCFVVAVVPARDGVFQGQVGGGSEPPRLRRQGLLVCCQPQSGITAESSFMNVFDLPMSVLAVVKFPLLRL